MAVVRVVMMQRDEGTALARWLMHYTALFDAKNITIFDNGSVDPYTLSLLKEAERRGVTVRYDLNTQHDFRNKGVHYTNVFLDWDQRGGYDFALPVDCDEILGVFTPEGLSFQRNDIHAAFDELHASEKRGGFRIETSLFNVPGKTNWYAPVEFFYKGFVSSQVRAMCDNGQHEPRSQNDETIYGSPFTYLHEHNLDYDMCRERLKRKLQGRVDPNNLEKIREYLKQDAAEGAYAAQALLLSRDDYSALYDNTIRFYVGDRTAPQVLLEGPNMSPTFWDGAAYRARHADVAELYELGTLQHYLRYGFKEGRALR